MSALQPTVTPAATDDRFCELPHGLRICFRTWGSTTGEPLLLLAGLGLHLTSWPKALVDTLVRQGFYVVAFDNRDVGRSSRASVPPPGRFRQFFRIPRDDGYDLGDMAEDTVGLLDHLGIASAHLVGMSMGGMISQTLAARHPERVRTLTSIFSTTGARSVGQPAFSTILRLAKPPANTSEESAANYLNIVRHIAATGFPFDDAVIREYALEAWERGDGRTAHEGVARQIGAIMKSGDRTAELRRITAPTLVIHGDNDLMVHPSGGEATAAAIPGARHVTIPGMGHHLADGVLEQLANLTVEHARRSTPHAGAGSR
ncbi:alpha/beta fold hydrolase [Pyxidicoccus fallax]|uniref:Alpha/beta fold hydrolase n=1 Tax=Pyxidicoccus fallax TaxID=394095 RepID=A0A848LAM7_9BACT|nr:alpha/beta fold hydrolase [Pyxidicoccus fallax]NMO15667.1 alpha/beta fold hydrolase [Pyxidicoccus fallax]NPC78787.1 alpha/beta fold hydrolase [Pyxidicoccus fallax]